MISFCNGEISAPFNMLLFTELISKHIYLVYQSVIHIKSCPVYPDLYQIVNRVYFPTPINYILKALFISSFTL